MRECDGQIEQLLKEMPSAVAAKTPAARPQPDPLASTNPRPKGKQSRKRNDPEKDLAPELARICGVDLTATHGLRLLTVLTLVSEIGVDMSKWRSAKAFVSWLGLCPNNKISGGRISWQPRATVRLLTSAATTFQKRSKFRSEPLPFGRYPSGSCRQVNSNFRNSSPRIRVRCGGLFKRMFKPLRYRLFRLRLSPHR